MKKSNADLIDEIDLTLSYFYEEFANDPQVWIDPICRLPQAGGLSPNDLIAIRQILKFQEQKEWRWAKWMANRKTSKFYGDHGCQKCYPSSEMLIENYLCPYHEALNLLTTGKPSNGTN